MTIIHRNADGTIKTFMEFDGGTVLAEGEILEKVELPFAEYAGRLVLSLGGKSGVTHQKKLGIDPVIVDVSCPGRKSVDLLINGVVQKVKLQDGKGTLTLDCDQRRVVTILPADQKEYCAAGEAVMTVIIGAELTLEDRVAALEKKNG